MTLTKAQLAKVICSKTGTPKWRSAELVDSAFEVIRQTLESGEDVLISGFGKCSVKEKGERWGRNPQIGEPIMLAPRKVVKFKFGSALRDLIDGKR